MSDATPAHIGDVQQAIDAVEVDERAEIGDVLHRALADVARRHFGQQLRAAFGPFRLDQFAPRQHDVLPLLVDFDHLEFVGVADELGEILRGDDVNLGCGQEGLDADVDHQPAFDDRLDPAGNPPAFIANREDFFPVLLELGLLLGKHNHALLVLEFFDEDIHFVPDFDFLDVVKFVAGDGAFALVSDIHQGFLGPDFNDATFDNFACGKARRAVLQGFFHREHDVPTSVLTGA
jgi:hypothetical protein